VGFVTNVPPVPITATAALVLIYQASNRVRGSSVCPPRLHHQARRPARAKARQRCKGVPDVQPAAVSRSAKRCSWAWRLVRLQRECRAAKLLRAGQRLGIRSGLLDFFDQQSRDLFRVLHATGSKQIAEPFKCGIGEHCHASRTLLLAEVPSKLSFLNIQA
jgi:hypothetical protein